MSVKKKLIQDNINEYVFDGQFAGQFDTGTIKELYINSIANQVRIPGVIKSGNRNIYFSWVSEKWDSGKLAKQVKRIDYISYECNDWKEVDKIILSLEGADLVYLRLSSNHPLVSKTGELKQYAEKVMFKFHVDGFSGLEKSSNVKDFSDIDTENKYEKVQEIARDVFEVNRFKRDPFFPEGFAEQVYASWVENAVGEEKNILCYVEEGAIVSFLIYDNKDFGEGIKYSFVELVATSREARNKSIASELVSELKKRLKSQGIKVLYANVDSENHGSIEFFKKNGFKQFNNVHEYHWRKAL